MQFLYPSLIALTGLLVAGPVLAHLLTRRRHRDVPWAAMEFLLESHRRNQSKVRLKEWLLLALRVAVVGLAGLLAAAPINSGSLDAWFTARDTTHLVVLDDSYSMDLRHGASSSWDEAIDAIVRLVDSAVQRALAGRVVVVRYSDELRGVESFAEPLTDRGAERLRSRLTESAPLTTAEGPGDVLRRATEIAREAGERDEPCFAYVLSDFTRHNHEDEPTVGAALEQLSKLVDGLVLAPCVEPRSEVPANLTLAQIDVAPGPVSAEVGVKLTLQIENPFNASLEGRTIRLKADDRELPTVVLEGSANNTFQREIELYFDEPGLHHVVAELSDDPLGADNRRWVALNLPARREAPIIDGSGDGLEGRAFATALRPRPDSRTGWAPRVERADTLESFGAYAESPVVMLLDAPKLAVQATKEIDQYVRDGGGLLISVGPAADVEAFNQSHASADHPLVAYPLGLPTQTLYGSKEGISAADHPLMQIFAGERGSFLQLLSVLMHHTIEEGAESTNQVERLLSFADETPLMMTYTLGKGRVVLMYATAATRGEGGASWTNLATLPVFPLLINETAGWLASDSLQPLSYSVGVRNESQRLGQIELVADHPEDAASASLTDGGALMVPGVYRSIADTGGNGTTTFAVNVDAGEARLNFPQDFASVSAMAPGASVMAIEDLGRVRSDTVQGHMGPWVGVLLLAALAFERAMAFSCSYIGAAVSLRRAP